MKKKILALLVLLIFTSCFNSLLYPFTAKAQEDTEITNENNVTDVTNDTGIPNDTDVTSVKTVNQIQITQSPTKTIYALGESLDFSDMIVTCYYNDGSSQVITDYFIEGYDINLVGNQTVFIHYQNYYGAVNITVIPSKITNIITKSYNTTSLTLTWDAQAGIKRYEIYSYDETMGTFSLITTTGNNSYKVVSSPGTILNYKICAVAESAGIDYWGEFSDTYIAATAPDKVTGLGVVETTPTSVLLTWEEVIGATGYMVYRSLASSTNYTYVGMTDSLFYSDEYLSSGISYRYKVRAYTLNEAYAGVYTSAVSTSTTPAEMTIRIKAGDQKTRLTWNKVIGATSYDIYMGNDIIGYTLLTTNAGNSNCSYIAEGLITGETYTFFGIARRSYNGLIYNGPESKRNVIILNGISNTSTTGKYFKTKEAFLKSWAYTKLLFFGKNVQYSKSVVIPGQITTNVGGFSSTSMAHQGITFAKDYLLITAYDLTEEENSVIYVMNKTSKKLLTTLILPSKTHAGGISYDGINIWITTGSKLSSVQFSVIEEAVGQGKPYVYINYNTISQLDITASYVTYYNKKLWVGTYDELKTTTMYSYSIQKKGTTPSLTKSDAIEMPTRVQGIAFNKTGTLILSRSCQLYKGLRGYMRQLDLYKPAFSKVSNGIIPLGECINSVEMPSMNEGIAIDGAYLYVNFESASFEKASYKMDRICAFKLTDIGKKQTTKK